MGKYITEQLVKNGKHRITAITRAGGSSKIPDGVHTAAVDYDDPSSLVHALAGQDALIITLATTAPPDTQSKLIEAAAKANVRWIMPNEYSPQFVSAAGKDIGVHDHVVATRQQIERLGLSWTGLTCSYWYEVRSEE